MCYCFFATLFIKRIRRFRDTRAKYLLEHAKRAVEIAIEQGEQRAIDWLESAVDVPIAINLGI